MSFGVTKHEECEKPTKNQTEIHVSEMLISLQTCDKNEARDGGVEVIQKSLETPDEMYVYVSELIRRKHYMSFGVYICNV